MDDVENLRKEVDMLKKQLGDPSESKDLVRAIKSLNQIFAEAHEDLKIDTHDAVLVGDKIDRIIGRLEKIEIQNEKIAKGIVAVADMIVFFVFVLSKSQQHWYLSCQESREL